MILFKDCGAHSFAHRLAEACQGEWCNNDLKNSMIVQCHLWIFPLASNRIPTLVSDFHRLRGGYSEQTRQEIRSGQDHAEQVYISC